MQEPEPMPPRTEGAPGGLEADTPDVAQQASPDTPRRARDPLARWLVIAILGIVILWLLAIVSAIFIGLVGPPKAPRTAVERDLDIQSAQVQSGKADAKTWAQYIQTLIQANQLGKASTTINAALASVKTDKSYILAEQARYYYWSKNYPTAVKAADAAEAEALKEFNAHIAALKAQKITNANSVEEPLSWSTASLIKAQSLAAQKDYKGAIKEYDLYLSVNPTVADVFAARAAMKALAGDKSGAAQDYRTALKFIPDYQPAIAGLKQIGASR
jgi:tetratricopeptide (TPR) repeat protein